MSPQTIPWARWLLPLLAATLVAFGGWGGRTLIAQGERLTRAETGQQDVARRLDRIEEKLDRVLDRRPR